MTTTLSDRDRDHLNRAIELAHEAGSIGNLPIGCAICLDGPRPVFDWEVG